MQYVGYWIKSTGPENGAEISATHTHSVSQGAWNCDTLLRRRDGPVSADAPTVMSCSMPTMMRSHSSSRLRSPHSPVRGLYISSLISSGVTGIPPPSVSGCGSARQHRCTLLTRLKTLKKKLFSFFIKNMQHINHKGTHHHLQQALHPKDSVFLSPRCPIWRKIPLQMLLKSSLHFENKVS